MEERIIKDINNLLTQLFQKMHEAGYEWSAEKKELRKIEQEENVELTDFESALFSAFSYAWQEYLSGKEVNVAEWVREHSAELLKAAREQKPACSWSEEDEKMFNSALWHIKNSCGNQGKNSGEFEVYNWLKSLKDRVLPQPKQEWSEEDETVLNNLIYALANDRIGNNRDEYTDWLKSLRPQNKWKPSNEQIGAIEAVINNRSFQTRHLYSLYEQLKKLREE